jgi:hypothetical protein
MFICCGLLDAAISIDISQDRVITCCLQLLYCIMQVILDLHGAPGSQNGLGTCFIFVIAYTVSRCSQYSYSCADMFAMQLHAAV